MQLNEITTVLMNLSVCFSVSVPYGEEMSLYFDMATRNCISAHDQGSMQQEQCQTRCLCT